MKTDQQLLEEHFRFQRLYAELNKPAPEPVIRYIDTEWWREPDYAHGGGIHAGRV